MGEQNQDQGQDYEGGVAGVANAAVDAVKDAVAAVTPEQAAPVVEALRGAEHAIVNGTADVATAVFEGLVGTKPGEGESGEGESEGGDVEENDETGDDASDDSGSDASDDETETGTDEGTDTGAQDADAVA